MNLDIPDVSIDRNRPGVVSLLQEGRADIRMTVAEAKALATEILAAADETAQQKDELARRTQQRLQVGGGE